MSPIPTHRDCYVGITNNTEEIIKKLSNKYSAIDNFRMINTGLSYEVAQKSAKQYAGQNCCKIIHFEEIMSGDIYYVYYFEI